MSDSILTTNSDLLQLCLDKFCTYNKALEANHYNGGETFVIRKPLYEKVALEAYSLLTPPRLLRINYSEHQFVLRQLPSGYYAWCPTNPVDMTELINHQQARRQSWLDTRVLQRVFYIDKEHENEDVVTEVKRNLRKALMSELAEKVDSSKKYRFQFKANTSIDERELSITLWLFYCEER
jgi:hypothetical protein